MQYGLEKEYFIYKDGIITSVPINLLPYDECGYLVEARGKPADNILEAVYLLKAEEHKLYAKAMENHYVLIVLPLDKIPPKLSLKLRRQFTKGITEYQNLYGYEAHRNGSLVTAGLHISFTNPRTIKNKEGYDIVVNGMFDYIQLFRLLDKEFKDEIKESKRNPGFYELKSDGRIEYRSLPNNVNLDKVIDVITKWEEEK